MTESVTGTEAPEELWPDVRPEAARRLMAAAVDLFAERGYHATTTRDIATAAGMSPAALYVHFPSKAAVLSAISRSGHQRALDLLREAAAVADPVEAMDRLVRRFVAWHARRHRVARVVQYELHALDEEDYLEVAELRRQSEREVREVIARGMRAGVFAVADVKVAARAVLSLGVDVARWYTVGDPEKIGADYAGLVSRMLGSAEHLIPRTAPADAPSRTPRAGSSR